MTTMQIVELVVIASAAILIVMAISILLNPSPRRPSGLARNGGGVSHDQYIQRRQ